MRRRPGPSRRRAPRAPRRRRHGYSPHGPHVEHPASARRPSRASFGHAHHDRPEPAHLVLGGHRAPVPGATAVALAAVVDQRQPLAFGVLEVERQPAVALHDRPGLRRAIPEPLRPPLERLAALSPAGAFARCCAVPRRSRGICQSKKVRSVPGLPDRVGIEEVVGAHVVLVDAALHQPHAQRLRCRSGSCRGSRRRPPSGGECREIHGPSSPEVLRPPAALPGLRPRESGLADERGDGRDPLRARPTPPHRAARAHPGRSPPCRETRARIAPARNWCQVSGATRTRSWVPAFDGVAHQHPAAPRTIITACAW